MDTKVDLDILKAIDNTTDLADYEYLGKEIEVPSKTIVLTDSVENREIISTYLNDETGTFPAGWNHSPSITGLYQVLFTLPFETIIYDEFGDFLPNNFVKLFSSDAANNINNTVLSETDAIYKNTSRDNINCLTDDIEITTIINADITIETSASYTISSISIILGMSDLVNGIDTQLQLFPATLISTVGFTKTYGWNISNTTNTSFPTANTKLYVYCFIQYTTTTTGELYMNFNMNTPSSFEITNNSLCAPTNAKLYLVNETLSHISEYVTNNCLRVYSEYLGRIDSSPYNFEDDGCGGMLALTSGLFLRRIEDVKTGDKAPKLALTFNDVLNATNCIYPLGMTIEQQGEDEVIRIEDWKHFYNDTVIADIGTVAVEKQPNLKLHFKNYKTGYSKYEAEEYNGLDEFLTEREYTTRLINHNGVLEKVCQFVASGYAIEITRRKGNTDSKDWRYDNDTFVLCLDRYYGALQVEQGNIVNDANIIDPSTILNFRISPARMAVQWFEYVTTFLKSAKELLFSSGKGNTAAEGELTSGCEFESGVLSEKQNITSSDIIVDSNGIYLPELHKIEGVPFTFQQYKSLQANPHGLFAYKCDETQRYGWVQECSYSFVGGTIDLILIPKVA
jgi:hypothetical protein